jgi:predicted PurR-regulated permease PerM
MRNTFLRTMGSAAPGTHLSAFKVKIVRMANNKWSRPTKYLVVGLYITALVWLVFAARPLLSSLVIALLLEYVLNPVVKFLMRHSTLARPRAVALTYLLFIGLVVMLSTSFTSLVIRQINTFSNDVERILVTIETFASAPLQIGQFTFNPPRETILGLDEEIRTLVSQGSSRAIEGLSGLGTNLVWLIVIFVATFYLLRDGPKLREWFIRQFPRAQQEDIKRLMQQVDVVWGTYLRGQVILAAIIGILTGLSMALVGLRGAIVIGIIVGILDLIPSLGPLVGGLLSVVVALILGSGNLAISNFWYGVLVGAIFILIQQFENIWLAPKILGTSLKIHPALVVIGVLGALALIGIIGALVIVPVMASVFIISRYVHAKLLDRDPWEPQGGEGSDDAEVRVQAKEKEPASEFSKDPEPEGS